MDFLAKDKQGLFSLTPESSTFLVSVLDLAAGSGVWSIALAQGSEKATVTVVDWPEVIPITRKTVENFGLGER